MSITDVAGLAGSDNSELEVKTCNTCGEEKPVSEFYDHWSAKDNLQAACKICTNNRRKKKYSERHELTEVEVSKLDRITKFVKGYLDPKDLTDEELMGRFIYNDDGPVSANGVNTFGSRMTFRELEKYNRPGNRFHAKLNKELSLRINEYIKSKSLRTVQVIFEIADSDTVEPSDRLKAATWLAERVIGKTPEVLLTGDANKAYEQIFDTQVESGSREDYRQRVNDGINESRLELEQASGGTDNGSGDNNAGGTVAGKNAEILDAEVVEDSNISSESGDFGSEGISGDSREFLGRSDDSDRDSQDTGVTVNGEARDDFKKRKAELVKARQKAKQRRFIARAVGLTSLERMPYLMEFKIIRKGDLAGKVVCRLVCPSEITEVGLAKLEATNEETDIALSLLYPELENEPEQSESEGSEDLLEAVEVVGQESLEDAQDLTQGEENGSESHSESEHSGC